MPLLQAVFSYRDVGDLEKLAADTETLAAAKLSATSSTKSHSTPQFAKNTMTVPRRIRWDRLSPRSLMIATEVAAPLADGYSLTEVATRLGVRKSCVSRWLADLRNEIEADAAPSSRPK